VMWPPKGRTSAVAATDSTRISGVESRIRTVSDGARVSARRSAWRAARVFGAISATMSTKRVVPRNATHSPPRPRRENTIDVATTEAPTLAVVFPARIMVSNSLA